LLKGNKSIVEEPLFEFSEAKDRIAAIRILFFTRKLSPDLTATIGDHISPKELMTNFKKHFAAYSCYPSAYNYLKKEAAGYSSLVINKNTETNKFNVFKNPDPNNLIKSDLDLEEALKFYIQEELKGDVFGIRIK